MQIGGKYIDVKGYLIYSRVLTYSHVKEQVSTKSRSNNQLDRTTEFYI